MILAGVMVEALKTMKALEYRGRGPGQWMRAAALDLVDAILSFHYSRERGGIFWEHSDAAGKPVRQADGTVVVDPGHATELAGFMAELAPFLEPSARERTLDSALRIHLFADRVGFTPAGAMSKYVDLETGRFLPDTQAAAASGTEARPTAPWWNVREHSAAALRLYTLTGDERLVESYRRAQHASYLLYPNLRLGAQMIQSIDPLTLEPLDLVPATGNLDPMHDARSRDREIECLEELLRAA
jgi:mannose/cellobiose epimerase-like protein (N-acyl-D-glucosamine 2-epimerase family)